MLWWMQYSNKYRKNNRYSDMAIPSVRMLFEYMDSLLAAKRHKKETARGINRLRNAIDSGSLSSFQMYLTRVHVAAAISMLWKKATAVK